MAKSWTEKYNGRTEPEIKQLDKAFAGIEPGENMLIATPALIDQYIRDIPAGMSISIEQMRKDLSTKFGADKACPVTTSMFLRIVAEKAHEELDNGRSEDEITPFWRVISKKITHFQKTQF